MIKIKALNETEESTSDELTESLLITREAQEEGLLGVYEEAIKTLSSGAEEVAKQMLLKLNDSLNTKIIKQKCSSEVFYQRLRYSTLKNLGVITNDLNYFLDALELDSTDVSLWLKTGRRAALIQNYQLARDCYESAYSLSPFNWIAIDRLIETTFVLHDLFHCFRFCCIAIDRDDTYIKAIVVFNECLRLHPMFAKDMNEKYKQFVNNYETEDFDEIIGKLRELKCKRRQHFEDERIRQESKRPKLTLILDNSESNNLSIGSIGLKLKNIYDRIKKNNLFASTQIDISFESGFSSQTDSGGNESGSANTSADESTSATAAEQKDKDLKAGQSAQTVESETNVESNKKLKRSNSLRNSTSNTFPTEFVDKRRSNRVKNILNKSRDIDERNVSESILELLPDSLKMAISEEVETTTVTESTEDNKKVFKCINLCEKSESDFVNSFVLRIKSIKFIRIDDLIDTYLCEISSSNNLIIPSVFSELYDIYRSNTDLPCGPLTVIGRDIELSQIWMCLTANELKFNRNEVLFLTQMLVPLERLLNKDKYNEYLVRLSMIRGTKESDNEWLNQAMDILCENQIEVMASNKVIIKYSSIKSIIESQSRESMSQMMSEHKFEELIKILKSKPESELKSEEINLLNDAIVSSGLWQKGIDILCTRADLNNECLSTIRKCLETGKRARLRHTLAVKLVKLAAEGYSVLPWICLYWGLISEGVVATDSKSSIIKFLKLGHKYLGKRGTCTSHNGEFLLLALHHFLEFDVEEEILRCFTCLFNFPIRRMPTTPTSSSTHFHKSPHIPLKWQYCEQLYHYFAPEELPEYDSLVRQTGITQDIEALLLRIVELVPTHLRPNSRTESIIKYIESGHKLEEEIRAETCVVTETIYYLLADYYFKNREFKKARQYYVLDLSLTPNRFDSWAGSALTRTFEVDQQLLSGENIDQTFYDMTIGAQRCFERALLLEPSTTKLWIEYGHFVYNISSSASRFRKTSLFKTSIEFRIESEDMIKIARNCFDSALQIDSSEELWLPYYMLGKVMEKSWATYGTASLFAALKYYEWAELCLYVDGTSYPKKIQYYNPPHLAVEALEIHYRIHASVLKFLTLNKKISSRTLKRLKAHLIRALRSAFSKQTTPSVATSAAPVDHDYATASAQSSAKTGQLSSDCVSELMKDVLDYVVLRDQKVDTNRLKEELVIMCLNAMRRCVDRYPAHYKSTYRLAHYYHNINDNITAKQLLLGTVANKSMNVSVGSEPETSDMTQSQSNGKQIAGLFAERKTNNLFNGIWRIPIDDIDRPGSFSAHMFRSTFLLIRVCTFTDDYHTLCTIAIQLSKTPDVGKKFLRDSDRQILAKLAFDSCHLLLKSHFELIRTRDRVVVDIQRIADRLIKANVFVNESNAMIRELFGQNQNRR